MEMNPATVTLETLKDYKSLGVNRASFGAQTFDDTELKTARTTAHRRRCARDNRTFAKCGFSKCFVRFDRRFAAPDFARLGTKS